MNSAFKMMNSAVNMMNSAFKMMNSAVNMMNFVRDPGRDEAQEGPAGGRRRCAKMMNSVLKL